MKKKLIALMSAVVMTVSCIAGVCTVSAAEKEESSDADYSTIKVGVITTVVKDDGGWCQAQYKGITDAMEECGMNLDDQLIFMENITEDATSTSNAVEALISEDCNMIIGASSGYAPFLSEIAPQYPDVLFAQAGAPVDNVLSYQIREYQGMYLLGYLCGLMSDSDKLGFVAPMSESSVRRGINAYALGAKAANEKATVQVVWTNSWYDTTAESESTNSLISSGIKYMGINASSPAIPQTCAKNGAFCTGYHQDMYDYAPDAVLVSYVWNWAPIFEEILTEYASNGNKPYDDYYFWGMDKDCAQISDMNKDLVPEDVQKQVQDMEEKIKSGEVDVYGGELKDNEGNVLVKDGESMPDEEIVQQEFFVDNVIGSWK